MPGRRGRAARFPRHGHCGDRRGPQRSGPAVGFRDGVGIGRSVRGRRRRRRRFRPAAGGLNVSVPEFDGADDEHLAIVAASLPSGAMVRNGRLASISTRPDNELRSGSTMLAELASIEEPICFWSCRADAVGVGRHQVGGPEPDGATAALECADFRPSRDVCQWQPAHSKVCAFLRSDGRTRDRRSRPASANQPARRRIVREHVLRRRCRHFRGGSVRNVCAGTSTRSPAPTQPRVALATAEP